MGGQIMNVSAALALACGLLSATPVLAGTQDILIGLDEKITFDASGQVNGPPGRDAVLIMDISSPAKPRIRASLPLMNSVMGPPTNLQITPDGKLGLVANSVVMNQDGAAWKVAPDNKVFVIDLDADPPKLMDTITVGLQPSGMAISHQGDLALVANRAGKSVSVLSIENGVVKSIGDVPLEQEAAAVAIAPDGRRAFVCLNKANKIGVLTIDGQKVTYDKSLDIPSAFNPYNVDITPDGKYVIASNTGAMQNNADAELTIEAAGPHPHVMDIMTPGIGPEGFAISPDGKTVAAPLLRGSVAKDSDWFKTKDGELAIMSVGADGKLTVTGKAPLGAVPEGVAFSPDSQYIYVGNFLGKEMQVFRLVDGKPLPAGPTIKLPGQPASMRGPAR
jgi:DNA-binding beta-propeller fold protein YncE